MWSLGFIKNDLHSYLALVLLGAMNNKQAIKRPLILFLIPLFFCLSACQPTPEIPPMVNRGEGLSENFIIPPLPEGQLRVIDAPVHITDNWESANGSIRIETDADIKVPQISNTPVVELRQKDLTVQRLEELVGYFTDRSKLYKIPPMTKADLEAELADIREQKGDYGSPGKPLAAYESRIAELMATAPQDTVKEYITPVFDYPTQTDGYYIFLKDLYMQNEEAYKTQNSFGAMVQTSDRFGSLITAQRYDAAVGSTSSFEYTRGIVPDSRRIAADMDYYKIVSSWEGTSIESFGASEKWLGEMENWLKQYDQIAKSAEAIPEDWARKQAEAVLRDLGVQNMGLERAETGVQYLDDHYDSFMLSRLGFDLSQAKGGYFFVYQRENGGLLCTGYGPSTPTEAPTFYPEFISIFVTDEGVQQFIWKNMAQPTDVIAQNTALASFDAVFESFKNTVVYTNYFGKGRYLLKNIELRATNVTAMGAPDRTWIVPVWVYKAEQYWTTDAGEEIKQAGEFVYMINAIDGGYVPDRIEAN